MMVRIALLTLVVCLGTARIAADGNAEAPQKFAFLVGINDYDNSNISDLRGCVNDVDDIRRLLTENFKFPPGNVALLTSATTLKPTRTNILEGIQKHLIDKTKQGRNDIVVFYYSGHGSQVPDQNGDERFDGKDETIVPCDSREEGKFDITDDELNLRLRQLHAKSKNLTFFLDSCHSGSGVRGMGVPKRVDTDTRPQPASQADTGNAESDSARAAGEEQIPSDELDYVLIAGCQPKQVSFEIRKGGVNRGALTYYFTEAVRAALNESAVAAAPTSPQADDVAVNVTYKNVLDRVQIGVQTENANQIPQIEGKRVNNFVFSDESSVPSPFVEANRDGDKIVLTAGKVQAMTVGSQFDVYPPGTNRFDKLNNRVVRVQITSVNTFSSEAAAMPGTGSIADVQPASQAAERVHAYGVDEEFPIYVLNPSDKALVRLGDGEDLEPSDESEVLRRLIMKIDDNQHSKCVSEPNDGRLWLGQIGDRIKMFQPSGVQIRTADYAIDKDLSTNVTDQIEHWTKWYNIRTIANIRSRKVKVKAWLTPDLIQFKDGDDCTIHVQNTGSKDLFFAILIISNDGSVSILYPPDGNGEQLSKGTDSIDFDINVSVTDGYDQNTDVVKVIATDTQLNFTFLRMGSRSAEERAPRSPMLDQLLRDVAGQTTTRQATLQPVDDWFTSSAVYTVKK